MSIESNIAGRQSAETLCELIVDSITELKAKHGMAAVKAFFAALRNTFAGELTVYREPDLPKPMTDQEAAAFGKTPFPFGKYKETPVEEVEFGYLDWIAEQPETFKADLNRYLMSAAVRRQREQ